LFERYTERARRSIFFAPYEASALGTMQVIGEELLLGILREDKTVAMRLNAGAVEAIRKEIEKLAPPKGEPVPTSVDLPIGLEIKRALAYAAEEADAVQHKQIDSPRLVLGLLRVEGCLAAALLRKHGLEYDAYRTLVEVSVDAVAAGNSIFSSKDEPEGRCEGLIGLGSFLCCF
jgi:ATP-dependent Clp protease ATP-binding subunit ClpC